MVKVWNLSVRFNSRRFPSIPHSQHLSKRNHHENCFVDSSRNIMCIYHQIQICRALFKKKCMQQKPLKAFCSFPCSFYVIVSWRLFGTSTCSSPSEHAMTPLYSISWVSCNLFIHSSVGRHLGWICVLFFMYDLVKYAHACVFCLLHTDIRRVTCQWQKGWNKGYVLLQNI